MHIDRSSLVYPYRTCSTIKSKMSGKCLCMSDLSVASVGTVIRLFLNSSFMLLEPCVCSTLTLSQTQMLEAYPAKILLIKKFIFLEAFSGVRGSIDDWILLLVFIFSQA